MGISGGWQFKKSEKCHGLPRKSIIFLTPISYPVVGRFRAQNHPGGAVLEDTWREGGREGGGREGGRKGGREGGIRKVGVRELEVRKVGG